VATGRLPDPNSAPVTAKGDLYTYSTVPAKLAVGNNGETLVADSSATTGLRWSAQPSASNPVVNGAFDVWQRGTSFSVSASSNTYTADRWQVKTSANQATTVSRQTTSDTTNLPFIQYAIRVQRNSGQTGTGGLTFSQSMETVNSIPYAGKTVTMSFYARRGADFSASGNNVQALLVTGTGTDQNVDVGGFTNGTNAIFANATLTTTWQRFTFTATLGATITQIAPYFLFTPTGTAGANDWYEVTGVQLDVGNVALPFRRNGATLAGELAACQRYYFRQTGPQANSILTNFGWGSNNAQYVYAVFNTPVTMRTAPTSLDYANVRFGDGSTFYTPTTLALASTQAGNNPSLIEIYYSTGGLTQYRPYLITCNNNTAGYLGVSAEL
jgi:hypothetical protein